MRKTFLQYAAILNKYFCKIVLVFGCKFIIMVNELKGE